MFSIKTAIIIVVNIAASFGFNSISDTALSKWITTGTNFSFILIDVRDSVELDSSSIIATDSCRPYNLSWNEGILKKNASLIPLTTAIVLYCKAGGRSASAATFLDGLNYLHIYSLIGGITTWINHSRPTIPRSQIRNIKDLPTPSMRQTDAVVLSQIRPSIIISQIARDFKDKHVKHFDIRGKQAFESFICNGFYIDENVRSLVQIRR